MTNDERILLVETAKFTDELSRNRNDMLIGITAALLDLYRTRFKEGTDSKPDALVRLELQQNELSRRANGLGVTFLKYLTDTLAAEKLDAAKLYREPPAGTA